MSVSVSINGAEVIGDLTRIGGRALRQMRSAIEEAGTDVRDEWRANATETAGAHGKHYPKAIMSKMTGPLEATIEPQEGMKQAGMSFEFGSRNQPPHNDGQRAIDHYAPLIARRIEAALTF
jgi:hypothetical protein